MKKEAKPFIDHGTIFDKISLDRNDVHWEDYLYEFTPVQFKNGIHFKREDMFAPLNYGGINGSKLRQAIWLMSEESKIERESKILLSATSIKSPQLCMGSAVALHYGFKSLHVIGATKPETAIKRPNVQMGEWFKAQWDIINIGYNHNLQLRIQDIKKKYFPDGFYLEYGITLNHNLHPAERVYRFHEVGANQVKNIPEDVETLVMPAGSCNSCTSVLLGLSLYPPKNLKDIYLIGVGPSKYNYMMERLRVIQDLIGKDCISISEKVHYYGLHEMKYVTYQDEIYESWDDIEFHSTYEAKVMKYIKECIPEILNPKTLFWIVGSKPYIERMEFLKPILGEYPTTMSIFNYEF